MTSDVLKKYHVKRPVYLIWQYNGEEVIPDEVSWYLGDCRVVVSQTPPYTRTLEIIKGVLIERVLRGYYVVIPPDYKDIQIVSSISEFEEE